jgi:hypothetical protein
MVTRNVKRNRIIQFFGDYENKERMSEDQL